MLIVPLHRSKSSIMGYEEHVYLAKLAEQAERYEGTSPYLAVAVL